MEQQRAEATVSGSVGERARSMAELIRQLQEIQVQRTGLMEQTERDSGNGAWRDCMAALDSHALELRNEIRKLTAKRPLVAVKRHRLLGGSYTEYVEQPEEPEAEEGTPASEQPKQGSFWWHRR
ncbi:MAG: hypothetical protein ABSG61_00975 [Gemmatimonadales bacterium]|jgi:hypothetical protein